VGENLLRRSRLTQQFAPLLAQPLDLGFLLLELLPELLNLCPLRTAATLNEPQREEEGN
jgi:hypothetical protein